MHFHKPLMFSIWLLLRLARRKRTEKNTKIFFVNALHSLFKMFEKEKEKEKHSNIQGKKICLNLPSSTPIVTNTKA